MREIRPSGLEGGVARKRHPYPYRSLLQQALARQELRKPTAEVGTFADGRITYEAETGNEAETP
jgi:hypothetical protein